MSNPTLAAMLDVNARPKATRLASSLRARAEEVLAKAETMKDVGAKQKMPDVAASYENLARKLEEHACDLDRL
jgi:hypothetical protein